MDKIYSRPRIKLPKINLLYKRNNRKQKKKIQKVLISILIILLIIKLLFDYINPMFEEMCIAKAKSIAIQIINIKTQNSIDKIDYNDIVTIIKDNNGNITMVKANALSINRISVELTTDIQNAFENENQTSIYIPIGSIFGNEILSNVGPQIPIQINPTGVVTTQFRSEFEAAGINQTIHRIYLYTVCKINIITPLRTMSNEVTSEVIVAESVIVGPVPDSYYNLEGLQRSDAMEVVE